MALPEGESFDPASLLFAVDAFPPATFDIEFTSRVYFTGESLVARDLLGRNGWLDRTVYQPLVDKAWQAILIRTSSDGRVFDIAESTGTRGLTLNDYLRRAAILDRDTRGGAFALLFATEMAGLQ